MCLGNPRAEVMNADGDKHPPPPVHFIHEGSALEAL